MRKDFPSFQSIKSNGWPAPVLRLRQQAFDAYQTIPFPTTHEEDWRFTNVAPYLKVPYRHVSEFTRGEVPSEAARGFTQPDQDSLQIVFVDGRFSRELSSDVPPAARRQESIFIGSIKDAAHAFDWESLVGKMVPADKNAFVAWNTAFFDDVALIHVPDGLVVEKPVQLSFIQTGVPDVATFPRVLLVLGKDSQLAFLETFTALSDARYFTNAVTEIVLREGAVLQHVKLQQDSLRSLHIATSHVLQERNSSYTSLAMTLGSELSRENLRVTLDGIGGDCTLNGLYLIGENQHCDHHTTIDHAKPHGTSRELYKGILNGKSRAVFNGKIIVRKDAQKTDAEQTNKNLLLTQSARINTTPQLEILADDVKCRHGATIGHLDDDALFYLRSRGITDQVARTMLMKGFLQDVTGRIPEGKIRSLLDELVSSRLMQFTGVNV